MATYESFVTGGSNYFYIYDSYWQSQTFTVGTTGPNENFTLNEIHGLFQRAGSPGTMTVELYAVDGSGHPTGSVLSSGTINANTFDQYGAVEETITMSEYELQASTEYAIVCHIAGGDAVNCVLWQYNSSGGYSGGNIEESTDSGSSWTTHADIDFLFLVDGTATSQTIVGQTDGVSDVGGSLLGIGQCVASTDDISSLSGTLLGQGELHGIIDGVSDVGGILGGWGDLQATFFTFSELSGILGLLNLEIAGQSDGVSNVGGTLIGFGDLVGQSDVLLDISGNIIGSGSLVGESNGTSELSLISSHEFELFEGNSEITQQFIYNSSIKILNSENSLIESVLTKNSLI